MRVRDDFFHRDWRRRQSSDIAQAGQERRPGGDTPKPLLLAADGASSLDLGSNNTTAIHLARDCNELVNQFTVETVLQQAEVSLLLVPLFEPSSADAANRAPFCKKNLTGATNDNRRMYRWYGVDECGDGHWNVEEQTWVTGEAGFNFTPIFPADDNGNATWTERYRPGSRTLISKDVNGKPLKAVLEIIKSQTSGEPAFNDGSINNLGYVTITGGYTLLHDRLGIQITVEDPDDWTVSSAPRADGKADTTKILALTWLSTITSQTNFQLRLTTVVEHDQRIPADPVTAKKRAASPTRFTRERSIDGKDHFQYNTVELSSIYYSSDTDVNGDPSDGTNFLIARDDTKAALTHAEALRSAHEFPTLAGSATIPFVTDFYQIGDRIQIIQGRNANLQINVGINQGETPTYPWVTAFAWDFQGDKQQTILQFSDRRAEPQGV